MPRRSAREAKGHASQNEVIFINLLPRSKLEGIGKSYQSSFDVKKHLLIVKVLKTDFRGVEFETNMRQIEKNFSEG